MTEPMWRSPAMQRLHDKLFPSNTEKIRQGICTRCEQPVNTKDLFNEAERKEVGITGLCGPCQRQVFKRDEEDCDNSDSCDYPTTTEEDD